VTFPYQIFFLFCFVLRPVLIVAKIVYLLHLVRLSVREAFTGRMSVKFDIGDVDENLSRRTKFG